MRTSIASGLGKLGATLGAALVFCSASGCHVKKPVEQHFYDQHIQTIFNQSCVNGTSPCHRVDPQTGVALGNLDLSSFETVQKRRDVLRTYANYPQPLLLLKTLPEEQVQIPYQTRLFHSEIKHAGGKPISSNSDAYFDLKRWLDNGANRDGILPVGQPNSGQGDCHRGTVPAGWTAPPAIDDATRASLPYKTFGEQMMPKIRESCAFGTCHASPQADFYMTCGETQQEMDFNFTTAASFIVPAGTAVEQSEILLRPLSARAGGINHTGGVYFQSREDSTWVTWRNWAESMQTFKMTHVLDTETRSPGRQFFEANVMPKLLQRGCALEGCHSPNGFNDFRLRPGAQGFLSAGALKRNYEAALREFMALDTVDVRQGRLVKKTLFTSGVGITHRGGGLLEDENTSSADPCPPQFSATYDPTKKYDPTMPADPTTSRALCVLAEWHRIERAERAGAVSTMASGEIVPLAFVSRPPNDDTLLQFDTYRGGADLKLADATMGMNGAVASVGNIRSGLTACAGLAGKDVDVRGPEWSYDGTKVVFAARPGAAAGLDLWLLDVAGGTCKQLTNDNGRVVNGVMVHNFDPVFSPDGRVVFSSTRAGTRTLKTFLPNADLFRSGPNLDLTNPEQMTFLLNSELSPAFMQDGRVSFTAEKATPDFYQLSGRRINWDLTDYHPLLAQRAKSTDTFTMAESPSVDYQQATEIREGLDRNFLLILSDAGARGGGGALATFNRSIGPIQADRTEPTFLRSMIIIDAAATGRMGTVGVYRSPFSLPNGEIMASYAANVTNPAAQTPKYDLVAVNEKNGARRALASDAALSYVEAALGYKRAETLLFQNLPQLVFGGGHVGGPADNLGTMHFPDLPMLATLLGANLRHGRNVEAFDHAAGLKVYIEEPPPASASPTSPPAGLVGSQSVFSQRTVAGHVPLQGDHSVKVAVPAGKPLILELIDGNGTAVFTMTEEHQVTKDEYITPGAPRGLFNAICAGCHGSISGHELDVAVTSDALTGASVSISRDRDPSALQQ